MHVGMFLSASALIFTFTVVGRAVSETYKKAGDKAVLSPGSVSGPITSITWKHGADIAVEWYGQEKTEYRDFKGRCEVNTNTGELMISNLSVKDSGSYTAEISNRVMETTEIKVITAVPKPTISTHCNPEETQCTLTCEASITKDTGPVTYSWMIGDRQIPPSSNWINITTDDTESVGKPISCQLENPVSSEHSDDIMSPITNKSSAPWIIAPVVSVLLIVLVIILVGVICWCKRRSGNADQSSGQYCACFNRKNSLNFERSRGTQRSANGAVTGRVYRPVPNEDGQEPVPTDINNEAAAIPDNQEDPNQHQLQAEPPGTNKGAEMPKNTSERQTEVGPDQTPAESTDPISEAATSSESQTVKNQDQPEPEPRGTTTEAEMPKNTSEHQTEVGPDQTPAESTDPSSEAETSAEAPNAEEPPDHHHQQEDETTEE